MTAPTLLVQTLNSGLRRIPDWVAYVLCGLPALWLASLIYAGGLGVDPVKELEHRLGKIALQLIVAVLVVTPLRRFTGISFLRFRRAIGVMAFVYVVLHLLVWLFLDIQLRWVEIWADIVKRPYITIGMTAFVLLAPLAATSNNLAQRRMGASAWRRLHLLTYPSAFLGAVHYLMVVKAWPPEPILYLCAVTGLLAARLRWRRPCVPA
jgi:sulfoxide reductase heme-binding subunit YedZ